MTDLEERAIRALCDVTMPEQNWHRRRRIELCELLWSRPVARLGITQEADLWFLVWRYRRQIADREVVAHAEESVKGEKHLKFS